MIIGIDGRYGEGDLVGVGNYIKHLTEGFIERGFEVIIFYSKIPKHKIHGTKNIIIKAPNRYLFEQFYLPRLLNKYKVDIYHATGNLGLPILTLIPTILTIHDLIPLNFESYFKFAKVPFFSESIFRLNTLISCYKAKKIITISEFVKDEVVNTFNIPSNKIDVVYSGVKIGKFAKLPTRLSGEKYILNHGGIDVRKNLDGLIKSFVKVNKKFPNYKLVISGENFDLKSKLEKLISEEKLNGSVIFIGYVSNSVLYALIKHATCICYTSLMEGFGMPVIEGFTVGTPVVCSNTTSLPEIAKNAALLVNPNNYEEVATAVISIIKNKKKAARMVENGKKVAVKYSWNSSVEKTIGIYKEVLG